MRNLSDGEITNAVRELYFWRRGTAGGFMTALFDLFCKADPNNFQRLGLGFPAHALAVCMWRDARSESEFFEGFGVSFLKQTEKQNG